MKVSYGGSAENRAVLIETPTFTKQVNIDSKFGLVTIKKWSDTQLSPDVIVLPSVDFETIEKAIKATPEEFAKLAGGA